METQLEVKLINHTPEPERAVAISARMCYSPKSGEELWEGMSQEEVHRLVRKLRQLGHDSVLEHVTFQFAVSGVSRALTHQLVRHRIGVSYSQRSQRYVREDQFAYIMPPSIAKDSEAREIFLREMEVIQAAYTKLCEHVPPEDARYLLPNAAESKLILSINCRALLHFVELRSCQRAQWEIRRLARRMAEEARKVAPVLLEEIGPPCETRQICPEGEMTCGRLKSSPKG